MAVDLGQLVVFLVITAKERMVDILLIFLTLFAPVLLVALSKWQNSLNTWYVPLTQDATVYLSGNLQKDVLALPEVKARNSITLFFIADKDCPCTKASFTILKTNMQNSQQKRLQLVTIDVHADSTQSPAWQKVLKQIPATPSLLVMDHQRLVYAGPVTAGNMCTTSVLKILGLSLLQAKPQQPVMNWLEQGCYCPLNQLVK